MKNNNYKRVSRSEKNINKNRVDDVFSEEF